MSSSASLPSPDNDYAAPLDAYLNKAFWDAAIVPIATRIRALEAVKADWEELIAQGTGQALAVIQANVEPQLAALTAIIDQLKSDVAAAEDAIAVINAGGIEMAGVVGLSAALALKADLTYVDAAIAALKGDAPAAYDTLVEIAAKLSEDDTALAGMLATIATKANKATKLKVGSGLSLDGAVGSDATPVEGDLSSDRLLALDLSSLVGRFRNARFITTSGNIQPSAGVTKWLGFLVGGANNGVTTSGTGAGVGVPGGAGCAFLAEVSDTSSYSAVIGGLGGNSSLVIDDTTYTADGAGGTASGGFLNVPGALGGNSTATYSDRGDIAIGGDGGNGPFGLGCGGGGAMVSNWTGFVSRPGKAATGYGAGGGSGAGLVNGTGTGGAGTPGCLLILEF